MTEKPKPAALERYGPKVTPTEISAAPSKQVIRAELMGMSGCIALGVTASGAAPCLGLCRKLIAAGHDPKSELHAYRNNVLSLIIKSLSAGAALRVDESKGEFVPYDPARSGNVRARIAQKRSPAATLRGDVR